MLRFWQIIFEGVVGSKNSGDIAIDDFSFTEGSCAYGKSLFKSAKCTVTNFGEVKHFFFFNVQAY